MLRLGRTACAVPLHFIGLSETPLSDLAEGLVAGKFKYDDMWGMTPAD